MVWLLLLIACHDLTETSAAGMVGRVMGSDGIPIEKVEVNSLEGRDVTDIDGNFAVSYKAPEQSVWFQWYGAQYRRPYSPEDDGEIVHIRLPDLRDVTFECALDVPCDAELIWELADGMTARATVDCSKRGKPRLSGVPAAAPDVSCRVGPDETPPVVDFEATKKTWRLSAGPTPVRVEVRAESGTLPANCGVAVGNVVAQPAGDGFWTAEGKGVVSVTASCDGRPALPVTLDIAASQSASIDWSPSGPELDLVPIYPDIEKITLVASPGEEGGWKLDISPSADGRFLLPPLPAGNYRVVAGEGSAMIPLSSKPVSGSLVLVSVPTSPSGKVSGLSGFLVLDEDLTHGVIKVEKK